MKILFKKMELAIHPQGKIYGQNFKKLMVLGL